MLCYAGNGGFTWTDVENMLSSDRLSLLERLSEQKKAEDDAVKAASSKGKTGRKRR